MTSTDDYPWPGLKPRTSRQISSRWHNRFSESDLLSLTTETKITGYITVTTGHTGPSCEKLAECSNIRTDKYLRYNIQHVHNTIKSAIILIYTFIHQPHQFALSLHLYITNSYYVLLKWIASKMSDTTAPVKLSRFHQGYLITKIYKLWSHICTDIHKAKVKWLFNVNTS